MYIINLKICNVYLKIEIVMSYFKINNTYHRCGIKMFNSNLPHLQTEMNIKMLALEL